MTRVDNKNKVHRVLIMAGGTGGHIFPALAVADVLKNKGINIQWLGTENGMESRLVPQYQYAINFIDIGGLRGKGIKTLLLLPFKLSRAIVQTFKLYREIKPDVVLGMGGFVTGPGGLVAWLLRKPLILHEQNAIAGLTNKLLYRLSKKVYAAFPGAFPEKFNKDRLKVIGNPVRKEIVDLMSPQQHYPKEWFKSEQTALNILVIGGSLGAAALNEKVPQALQLVDENVLKNGFTAISVRHQCGEKNLAATQENYRALKETEFNIDIVSFIADMADSYQWADVIICRAGALTVSEIAAAGIASILVPFPYAVDDHQTANAQYLSLAGAAYLIQQDELSKEKLADVILALDKKTIFDMACKARDLSINNAAEVVAQACLHRAE